MVTLWFWLFPARILDGMIVCSIGLRSPCQVYSLVDFLRADYLWSTTWVAWSGRIYVNRDEADRMQNLRLLSDVTDAGKPIMSKYNAYIDNISYL